MTRLVVFDCDGVLVDSERVIVRHERLILAELGWPLTEAEIVERFMGRTAAAMHAAVEAQLGDALPAGWREEMIVPGAGTIVFDDMRQLPGLLARHSRSSGA